MVEEEESEWFCGGGWMGRGRMGAVYHSWKSWRPQGPSGMVPSAVPSAAAVVEGGSNACWFGFGVLWGVLDCVCGYKSK